MRKKKLSRREFLRVTGAAAAGAAFSPWLQGCSPLLVAERPRELEGTGLSLGCAVGDVTPDGAVVWLRAEEEGLVSIHYGKEPSLPEFVSSEPVRPSETSDFTAKVALNGLEPGTVYYYRATLAGKKPGPISRFITAPDPEDAADVRFAFSGDSRQSYQPFSIMDSIRAMEPDFFLHLGDTIYADREGVATRLPQFWAKYAANRMDPPTRRLLSQTSLYVTWDDHEVRDNYHPDHPLAPIGRKAFFDYWPVRQDPADPERLYRSFRWGKAAEIFILDTRQYRVPDEGSILGGKQREWFLESLTSSAAIFKFIATSVPCSSPSRDKWGGFREERDQILRFIKEKNITGVIFLAADVHYAAVARIGRGSGLREFIAGPIGAPMGLNLGTARRLEFFSRDYFNYGLVKVHGKASPPYTEIALMGEDNQLLYQVRMGAESFGTPGRSVNFA